MKHHPIVMMDEPPPFGTPEIWEQYLAKLERLPNGTPFKEQDIKRAKERIARLKAHPIIQKSAK